MKPLFKSTATPMQISLLIGAAGIEFEKLEDWELKILNITPEQQKEISRHCMIQAKCYLALFSKDQVLGITQSVMGLAVAMFQIGAGISPMGEPTPEMKEALRQFNLKMRND